MTEQAKTKTTQEKIDEVQARLNQLSVEGGVLQYNIQDKKAELDNLNLNIKNAILDMNKLNQELQKEKNADAVQ